MLGETNRALEVRTFLMLILLTTGNYKVAYKDTQALSVIIFLLSAMKICLLFQKVLGKHISL
jgi:hypothetical protein